MMAFQSPGVQVLGLTTIFGNCTTEHATRNALILVSSSTHFHGKRSFSTLFLLTNSALSKTDWQCEKAGHPEVPVAEGSHEPLKVLFILHVLQFAGACLRNSCEIRRFCVPSCGINLLLFLSVLLVQRHYMEKNQCNYIMYIIWMYKIFFSEFRVHFFIFILKSVTSTGTKVKAWKFRVSCKSALPADLLICIIWRQVHGKRPWYIIHHLLEFGSLFSYVAWTDSHLVLWIGRKAVCCRLCSRIWRPWGDRASWSHYQESWPKRCWVLGW